MTIQEKTVKNAIAFLTVFRLYEIVMIKVEQW